jgi:hypothetical protein
MEIKTKIGIKYCGGCNPTYERGEMIERGQSQVGEQFLFLRHDQYELDGLVLINGCLRSCATQNLNHSEVPYLSVAGESDFERLIEWLAALD